MFEYLKKANNHPGLSFMFFMIISYFLVKWMKFSPLILGVPFLVFVPVMVASIVFTIICLTSLVRNKNSILFTTYSLLTFISYKLSDVYTSNLIYEALNYNPMYVPRTSSIISIFSLILIEAQLTAGALIIYSYGSLFLRPFIRPFLNKFKYSDDEIYKIGFGSNILGVILFLAVSFVVHNINFNELIQKAAIELDYYPIHYSTPACKNAKEYEKFNYLSKNVISVYRNDIFSDKPIFSVINCTVI
ncbi:hypothetical protein [Legionella sp.]|uniref:hypothetical protein n=1 Tax=Legionella sp. TaxID=459 RepID=UPI003CA85C45